MKTLLHKNSKYFDPIVYHIGSNLSDPPKITSQPFSATKEEPQNIREALGGKVITVIEFQGGEYLK